MSTLPIPPEEHESDVMTSDINEPNFFALLPNIVEELLTDAYERSLYWHYRKVTGEHGFCREKTVTTAAASGMGVTKLREVRQSLHDKRLIIVTKIFDPETKTWDTHQIRMVPVWAVNNFYYWLRNPNKYQNLLGGLSPDEVGVLRRAVEGISPDAHKEESFKNNLSFFPANAGTEENAKQKREPIQFPVKGLTAKLLEEEANKKNGAKKKRTPKAKVEVVQVELTPLEDAIARHHYGWSVKDRAKWNDDRWNKLAEIKLAYEECGMNPEDVAKFKAWYEGDKDRFGWNMPGQANLCGWVGRWRASLPKSDAASGDNISLTPLQARFVEQYKVSAAQASRTNTETIVNQLLSAGDSIEFVRGLMA